MFKQDIHLIGVTFILNIVNILVYDLDHKILIIVNNSMKSTPKIRTHTHTYTHTLSREFQYLQ